jgi:GNAT superfamily N-acetyltransferase
MHSDLDFALDPELTDGLRTQIIALWTDASNAGGAVGFAGPVTTEQVRPMAENAFAGVEQGHDRLLVGYADGALAGMLLLVSQRFALTDHWRTVKRVMIRPDLQGRGYGRALIAEAERVARRHGWSALHLTVRGGTGLDHFYIAAGYREVGRFPGALRLAPDDDRDETHFWLALT